MKKVSPTFLLSLFLLCAAPTAGDLGSCGQEPVELDATKFYEQREIIDCERCGDCGLLTRACERACDAKLDVVPFPEGCLPLVHDGEVCLNALASVSCGSFESYVADEGATMPTECDFCPLSALPGGDP